MVLFCIPSKCSRKELPSLGYSMQALKEVTLALNKASNKIFPAIKGKPTNYDILTITNLLILLLMRTQYDFNNIKHHLWDVIANPVDYVADNTNGIFSTIPPILELYTTGYSVLFSQRNVTIFNPAGTPIVTGKVSKKNTLKHDHPRPNQGLKPISYPYPPNPSFLG